jgi:hypothetical protein
MERLPGVAAGAVVAGVAVAVEVEAVLGVRAVLPVTGAVLLPAEASRLAPDRPDYRRVHAVGNLVRGGDGDRVEPGVTQADFVLRE